jgi:hypothetical protein
VSGFEGTPLSVDRNTGAFTSFPLPCKGGLAQIVATAPRYRRTEVTFARGKPGEVKRVVIDLPRDDVARFGTLRGSLKDARTGKPVQEGVVFVPGLNQRISANPGDGRFLARVQAGRWDILVSAPGYETQRKHVIISDGDVIILDLDLHR